MLSCTGGSETGRWGPGRALARQHRWCAYDLTALPLLQWQVVQRLAHMYDELSSYGSASQQYEALLQQYNVRVACIQGVSMAKLMGEKLGSQLCFSSFTCGGWLTALGRWTAGLWP